MKYKIDERRVGAVVDHATAVLTPIFRMMGWTWFDSEHPPTHDRIRVTVEELIENVLKVEGSCVSVATGRIRVSKHIDPDYEGQISIEIVLDVAKEDVATDIDRYPSSMLN